MQATTPQQWLELIEEGFAKQDLEQIVSLYDPGAVLVPEPGQRARGQAAIQDVMGGFVALNGTLKFTPPLVTDNDTLAALYTSWTFDAAGPDGPINLAGNATVVLAKKNDGWVAMIDDFWSQG